MGVYTHDGFICVILYPETLLNSFISFSSFLIDSLKLYIIMLSVNDIVLLIFLYCMPFIPFLLSIALARTSMVNKFSFQVSKQKYGYYYCKDCSILWESAYVGYLQGSCKVYFKKICRTCQKSYNPYQVENITYHVNQMFAFCV